MKRTEFFFILCPTFRISSKKFGYRVEPATGYAADMSELDFRRMKARAATKQRQRKAAQDNHQAISLFIFS
jgi:hypothetical protein